MPQRAQVDPIGADGSVRETKRGEARRRAFLDAARTVFLAEGFEAASVNEVVRIAGGSLATLYAQFGSKEGLFLAMAEDAIEQVIAPLDAVATSHRPLREGLAALGETFLEAVMRPNAIAMFRIVVGEGAKFPDVLRRYMALGPDRVRRAVRAYLEERREAGELRTDDIETAVSAFMDLVVSQHRTRAVWDSTYELDAVARRAHVARAVDILLGGIETV